ncbi:MAG: Stp1/IreP family PP2C-type Ser/Thr phosphatase [Erysipelotrichaceae bacterium]|nr:Stp1/IreP family PP2C-type Ser/Thr phosphatase [Erysipelotrichaceae bacterium]
MRSFYLTDVGKVRNHNEDSVIILKNHNNEYLLAVADGMGGHRAGEVASSIAITYLAHHFQESFYNLTKDEAIIWINDSIDSINTAIFNHEKDHPESIGMGTTLVMVLYTKDYLLFGNIGDSSGFIIKNKKIHKVTVDHSLVNLLVEAGELTEEQAKTHPRKNVLMKALGASQNVEADIFECSVDVDGILLASDGLTNMLEISKIEDVINSKEEIEEKIVNLIQKANNNGGLDNISVAYLEKDKEVK